MNADTGELIDGITSIEWGLTAGGIAVATINLIGVPAELVGTVNPKEEPHEPFTKRHILDDCR